MPAAPVAAVVMVSEPSPLRGLHGLDAVEEEIEENLLDLDAVTGRGGRSGASASFLTPRSGLDT